MSFDLRCAVLCYALAGVAHELAHVLAHAALALAKRQAVINRANKLLNDLIAASDKTEL